MLTPSSKIVRTRIVHRDFICKGADHHPFRAAVKVGVTDDGGVVERSSLFMSMGRDFTRGAAWMPIPLCPFCESMSEESATYNPDSAQVGTADRFVAWLSPDGQRIAIPGRSDAPMRERYATAGYIKVEASSIRDMDRFSAIRERQTGHSVDSEMNYEPATRQWHDEAPYDSEDMTNRI